MMIGGVSRPRMDCSKWSTILVIVNDASGGRVGTQGFDLALEAGPCVAHTARVTAADGGRLFGHNPGDPDGGCRSGADGRIPAEQGQPCPVVGSGMRPGMLIAEDLGIKFKSSGATPRSRSDWTPEGWTRSIFTSIVQSNAK